MIVVMMIIERILIPVRYGDDDEEEGPYRCMMTVMLLVRYDCSDDDY